MSRDVYSEINLHLVWHTKDDVATITDAMEKDLYPIVRRRVLEQGAFFHEVGGTPNHVHVVVSILPTVLISDFMGKIKGGSSHDLNILPAWPKALQWQEGYGVVSFGTRDLPWVVQYVRNQKEHHALGTAQDRLERLCREVIAEAKEREAR
jgi:putative transposase